MWFKDTEISHNVYIFNLKVIVVNFHPLLVSLSLSCYLLVVLPHQLFRLSVEESVNLIFHQDMKEAINSFVHFAIHECGVVL